MDNNYPRVRYSLIVNSDEGASNKLSVLIALTCMRKR
jgi:hypothetical protein